MTVQEQTALQAQRKSDQLSLEAERAAVAHALEGCVPVHELAKAHEATSAAEQRVEELQTEVDALVAQAETVSDELARAHEEIAEMTDSKEIHDSAVKGLEHTLEQIQASIHHGCDPEGDSSQGMAAQDTAQLKALSRQIMHAKLAEAEAQKKLKASSRHQLHSQQRMAEQSERIGVLREEVAALRKELVTAKKASRNVAPQEASQATVTAPHCEGSTATVGKLPNSDVCFAFSLRVNAPLGKTPATPVLACGLGEVHLLLALLQVTPLLAFLQVTSRAGVLLSFTAEQPADDSGAAPLPEDTPEVAFRIELAKKTAEIEFLQQALAATEPTGLPANTSGPFDVPADALTELQLVRQELSTLRCSAVRCAVPDGEDRVCQRVCCSSSRRCVCAGQVGQAAGVRDPSKWQPHSASAEGLGTKTRAEYQHQRVKLS